MMSLRTVAITATLATFGLTGCAHLSAAKDSHHSSAASKGKMSTPMGNPDAHLARMDEQIEAMQSMHDKMMAAQTPEERSTMMTEHMEVMQNSMTMMGESGTAHMMEKDGMGAMKDKPAMGEHSPGMAHMKGMVPTNGDMSMQNQMMEKRMQMMQSMMQMMMDRMPPAPAES